MLEPLFGSKVREHILVYLITQKEGYAREMARFYNTDVSQIQKQLARLETGGVLQSRSIGKTRLFRMNTDYPLYNELERLVLKSIALNSGTSTEMQPQTHRSDEGSNRTLSIELL